MNYHWLSYGAGVNSTALGILLVRGEFPDLMPFRMVFADTKDEKDDTYHYLDTVARPFFRAHGVVIETVQGREGVLERWQRLKVTGSRLVRGCTEKAKIDPIRRHIKAHTPPGVTAVQLIGIDAGESHRASPARTESDYPRCFPLVDRELDRDDCAKIIASAGLPQPPKSGCWHCPFMRVGEVMDLARDQPKRFGLVVALEDAANETHGSQPDESPRRQWGDLTARQWAKRSCERDSSGPLFQSIDPDPPCACYDG